MLTHKDTFKMLDVILLSSPCVSVRVWEHFFQNLHTQNLIPNMLLLLQDDGCLTGKCAPTKSKGSCSLKQNTQLTNLEAHRTLTYTREK